MAQIENVWRVVEQVDPAVTKSQKGNPQRGIRTQNGWVKVRGDMTLLDHVAVGDKVEIAGLNQFKSSWYGELVKIEKPTPKQEQPEGETAAPHSNGNGKIPWAEFALAFKAAHALAKEVEPDGLELSRAQSAADEDVPEIVTLDRSAARASMVDTLIIAFSNGKIATPDPADAEGGGVPF